MPQPPGYEPFMFLFRVDESYVVPVTRDGYVVTNAKVYYTRWFNTEETALAEVARLIKIKDQNIINGRGTDYAQISVTSKTIYFYNKRTYVTPLLNELGYTRRTFELV